MIVDASVAVKWLIDEPGSKAADTLLAGSGLASVDLLFAEVANTLWKTWRRGDFVQMPEGLATLPSCFEQITPCAELAVAATHLAIELDHPAYDCFYLAMAIANNTTLVTADRRFITVCASSRYANRLQELV